MKRRKYNIFMNKRYRPEEYKAWRLRYSTSALSLHKAQTFTPPFRSKGLVSYLTVALTSLKVTFKPLNNTQNATANDQAAWNDQDAWYHIPPYSFSTPYPCLARLLMPGTRIYAWNQDLGFLALRAYSIQLLISITLSHLIRTPLPKRSPYRRESIRSNCIK